MSQECQNRRRSHQLFERIVSTAFVCSLGIAAATGQSAQEGLFVPTPQVTEATALPTIHPLVGELVRIEVSSPFKELVGRLVSIDSTELVVSVDGARRIVPTSEVRRIEAAPKKRDRTGRWVTVAGLAGIVAAFLFGQVGGY